MHSLGGYIQELSKYIYRWLRGQYPDLSVKELTEICVDSYNNTIDSTTKKRPPDLFFK